jgi:hypothetical protein
MVLYRPCSRWGTTRRRYRHKAAHDAVLGAEH